MIDKLFEDLVKMALESEKKEKKPIGFVSDEIRREYIEMQLDKEELESEIEFKMERMKKRIEREIFEEFNDRVEEMSARKTKIWDKIYNEMGVEKDTDREFNINTKTGVISEIKKASPTKRFN